MFAIFNINALYPEFELGKSLLHLLVEGATSGGYCNTFAVFDSQMCEDTKPKTSFSVLSGEKRFE